MLGHHLAGTSDRQDSSGRLQCIMQRGVVQMCPIAHHADASSQKGISRTPALVTAVGASAGVRPLQTPVSVCPASLHSLVTCCLKLSRLSWCSTSSVPAGLHCFEQ